MTHKLYSAEEIASILKLELDTLYRYARRGKIKGVKLGKLWRFSEEDLEAFLSGARVPPAAPRLLTDMLRSAVQSGGSSGVHTQGTMSSYAEIDRLSTGLALTLVAVGLQSGDRVVTVLPNSMEWIVACFGIWKAGGVLVPESTAIRPANLLHVLTDSRPAAMILDRMVAEKLETMGDLPETVKTVFIKDRTFALSGLDRIQVESLDAVLERRPDGAAFPGERATPTDTVSITYTSGSTGTPKGVLHTHESWLAGATFTRDHLGIYAKDKIAIPLPLHHGLAFRQVLAYILSNATILLASDIYQALKLLKEQKPTALVLVPAACNIAVDHFAPVLKQADAHLRYVEVGSAPLAPGRLARLKELLPTTAIHLPYGLTESRVGFLARGSQGLLNRLVAVSPGLAVEVVDAQGNKAGPGESGEVLLKGRGLMKRYWNRPESEALALARDGFHTGDMARLDESGNVEILGRLDDVLKVGGKKVNPVEVEMALNQHGAVAFSAVAGFPDPQGVFENRLHAFVVLKDPSAKPTETEIVDHCRRLVEPHKVPAVVHFRSSLPMSTVGKVLRSALEP